MLVLAKDLLNDLKILKETMNHVGEPEFSRAFCDALGSIFGAPVLITGDADVAIALSGGETFGIKAGDIISSDMIRDFDPALIRPIEYSGRTLGMLYIWRTGRDDAEADIISEYALICLTVYFLQSLINNDHTANPLYTLTASEKKAVRYVFSEMQDDEGSIVISSISSKYDITRSIIVNALKKLETAGVLSTKTMGMKGTYIKLYRTDLVRDYIGSMQEK